MKNIFFLLLVLFCIFMCSPDILASDTIRVLILNDAYSHLPAKNENVEKLGNIQGNLLLSGTHYTGNIEVWRGENDQYIVNELPLEEYIKDVVAVEVKPDWDMEALKAQAVVSRTYASYQKRMNGGSFYQIASSVLHQVYKGSNPDVRVAYAVENTSGEILTYNGKPIEAFYHSTCGGMTEDVEEVFGKSYPYLKPVESPCTLSPYSSWEKEIPIREIENALKLHGIRNISIRSFTSSKRVKELAITHQAGVSGINATEFRKALGWTRLPSTHFTIRKQKDMMIFLGKGYGHGVGLCQWCALEMAAEGKDYKEILSFFYPGTILQSNENY
jgi:stage II sporulation protein D